MTSYFCFGALLCQKYELLFAGSSINTLAVICVCLIDVWFAVRNWWETWWLSDFVWVGGLSCVGSSRKYSLTREISSNDFDGLRLFLLLEWRLRTVTNFLNDVSYMFQAKHVGEVYVVDIYWFKRSRLFQVRMRQLIQWLYYQM